MPRPTTVSYEDVQTACQEILAEGHVITFARVYAKLDNRGGQARVSAFIKQFQESQSAEPTEQRQVPDLPSEVVAIGDGMFRELWKIALAHADSSYIEDRNQWQAQAEAAEHQAQAADQRADQLQHELDVQRAAAEAREQTILDLEARLRDATERLAVRDERIVGLREDNARLTAELNATSTQFIEVKADLEKARQDEQKSRNEANVLRGQLEAFKTAKGPAKPAKRPIATTAK